MIKILFKLTGARLAARSFLYWAANSPDKRGIKLLLRIQARVDSFVLRAIKLAECGVNPKHSIEGYDSFFEKHLEIKDRTVLDVGSGYGHLADIIYKKASYVLGLDIRPDAVEWASKMFSGPGLEFKIGNFLEFEVERQFDAVVLSNVLEHVEGRKDFLVKAASLGEKILIRVPAFNRSWIVPYKKRLGLEWRLHSGHYIEYTEDTLREEVEGSGLVVDQLSSGWGNIFCVARKIGL